MFHRYLSMIYEVPSVLWFALMGVLVLVWMALAERFCKCRGWVLMNRIGLLLAAAAIVAITILVRSRQSTDVFLDPLYAWKLARRYPDAYRQMMLNVVLFFPLGLTMPFAFSGRKIALWTTLSAIGYSAVVECSQFALSRGYFELGDIFLNLFGALIGLSAYLMWRRTKNVS